MATPKSVIKASRPKLNGKSAPRHSDLFEAVVRHLADQEMAKSPEMSRAQARAQAHRQIAAYLGITRGAVYQMRFRAVAAKHWAKLERLTGGLVTAEQFENQTK